MHIRISKCYISFLYSRDTERVQEKFSHDDIK